MAADGRVWDFFYRNKSVLRLSLVALMMSSFGDLFAGATLGFMTGTLRLMPGLMILIPPAIGMRGNIFGALGSRLGTSMHVGTFELSLKKGGILRQNLEGSLVLSVIMSFLMGVLAESVSVVLGVESIGVSQFVFISVFGGVLAGLLLLLINILIATVGFRRNWDIDNVSAPLVTAAGDIITLPMLFVATMIVMSGVPAVSFDIFTLALLAVTVVLVIVTFRLKNPETKRIIVQSSPVLFVCILLDIGAGITIDRRIEELVALPALLILIPQFLEDANALGGILTSRFSSLLHMGILEPTRTPGKLAVENFLISYVLSLWVFIVVGITSHFTALLLGLGSPGLLMMVALSLVAGMLTVTILNVLSYYVAVYTFRLSLDPDDDSIPLTSSTIDFLGALCLIGVMLLLGMA
jgi:mgtE-like transporter